MWFVLGTRLWNRIVEIDSQSAADDRLTVKMGWFRHVYIFATIFFLFYVGMQFAIVGPYFPIDRDTPLWNADFAVSQCSHTAISMVGNIFFSCMYVQTMSTLGFYLFVKLPSAGTITPVLEKSFIPSSAAAVDPSAAHNLNGFARLASPRVSPASSRRNSPVHLTVPLTAAAAAATADSNVSLTVPPPS